MDASPVLGMADRVPQVLGRSSDDGDAPPTPFARSPERFPPPMALRVTRPTAAPRRSARGRGRARSSREDLAGYRALFADAAAQEDVHARYATRRALLEAGLQGPASGERRRRSPQRFAAVAGVALDALEDEPREPVLPQLRGRRAVRARLATPPPRRSSAPRCRLDPDAPARAREPRRARRRRRTRRAARRCRPPSPPSCRGLATPRRARRRRRPPGHGPDAEPLHDRQGRGGDAAALPRRRPRRRRRDRHRRHRLDRPHDRDRAVVRREGHRARVDRLVRRRPQRLLRRRHRRLAHVPRRRRGPRRRRRPAPARAPRPHLARGLLPRRDELHRRARRRHRRHPQRAARVPQPPRVPLRGPHPRADRPQPAGGQPERIEITDVRVEHYGYLGVVRDAKDKSRRNIELLERQRDEGRRGLRLPALQPRLRVRRRWARTSDALRELRDAPGSSCAAGPTSPPTATSRRSSRASCARCASPAGSRGAIARADEGLRLLPGLHRPRLRAGRWPPPRRADRRPRSRCSSAASRWATRRAATRRPSGAAATSPRRAGEPAPRGAATPPRRAALLAPLPRRAPAASSAPSARTPSRCSPTAPRPDEVARRVEARVDAARPPSARFMLGTALYEAGARRGGRGAVPRRRRRPAAERRRARRARRGAAVAAPLGRGRRGRRRRSPTAPPFAGAARRTELFARDRRRRRRGRRATPPPAPPRTSPRPSSPATTPGGASPPATTAAAGPRRWASRRSPSPSRRCCASQEFDAFAPVLAGDRALGAAGRAAAASCSRTSTCAAASSSPPPTSGSPSCNEGTGPDAAAFVGLAQVAWGLGAYEDAIVFAREAASLDPPPHRARPGWPSGWRRPRSPQVPSEAADDGRYESVREASRTTEPGRQEHDMSFDLSAIDPAPRRAPRAGAARLPRRRRRRRRLRRTRSRPPT